MHDCQHQSVADYHVNGGHLGRCLPDAQRLVVLRWEHSGNFRWQDGCPL